MNKHLGRKARFGASPAKNPSEATQDMMLLEPRVMFDATLAWDVTSVDDLTDALEGISLALQADMTAFTDFSDQLDTALQAAILDFAPVLGGDDATLAFVSATIGALKASAEKLQEGAAAIVADATDADSDDTDFAENVAEAIGDWLVANSGTAVPDDEADDDDFTQSDKEALEDIVTANDLEPLVQGFFDDEGDIATKLADVFNDVDVEAALVKAGITVAAAQDQLAFLINKEIQSNLPTTSDATTFEFSLEDFTTVGGQAVTYTYDVENDEVDVSISLPALDIDLNALFATALPNGVLPIDISVTDTSSTLTYSIAATSSTDGDGDLTAIGYETRNFGFDNLLALGGTVAVTDQTMSLGLLQMDVDSLRLADFQLAVNAAGTTAGASVDLTETDYAAVSTSSGAVVTATAQIRAATAAADAAFTDVVNDASYDLLTIGLSGSTDFVTGITDTTTSDDAKSFGSTIVLSAALSGDATTTSAQRITEFLASASVDTSFEMDTAAGDAATRATMETALTGLSTLSANEVTAFLLNVSNSMTDLLTDSAFDIPVAFTDINIGDVVAQIGRVFANLPSTFLINPADLGFTLGAPVDLTAVPPASVVDGSAMTDAQIEALQDIDTAHFRIITDPSSSTGFVSVDLDLSANAVMQDASSTPAEILAEFVTELNKVVSAYGLAAQVVGSAIKFVARSPNFNSALPVPSLSLVGVTNRNATAANDTFSLSNLGFGAADLTTSTTGFAIDSNDTLGAGSETRLNVTAVAGVDLLIDNTLFDPDQSNVTSVSIQVTIGGVTTLVTADRPDAGWTTLDSFVTSLKAALITAGVSDLTAAQSVDGTGITLTHTNNTAFFVETDLLTPLQFELASALNQQTSEILNDAQIDALHGYSDFEIRVPTGNQLPDGSPEVETINIDVSSNAVFADTTSTRAAVLDEFAKLLNDELETAYGISVVVDEGALRVSLDDTQGGEVATFSITGATDSVGNFDDAFSLANLGFGVDSLADVPVALSDTDGTEQVLNFKGALTQNLVFGANFDSATARTETLRFEITEDGVTRYIDISQPENGWTTDGTPNYTDIAASFNTAFTAIGVEITTTGTDAGLSFAISSGESGSLTLGIDPNSLTDGLTLDGVLSWVNEELKDLPVFAGSTLSLTEAGELILTLPEVEQSASIDSNNQLSHLSADDLGLGNLTNLSLSANLNATLHASLSASAGIDLVGLTNAFAGDTTLADALSDNIFVSDIAIDAGLRGIASGVTGTANLGLVEVNIGHNDAEENFVAIDTQLDIELVGQDDAGDFQSKITLENLATAVGSSGSVFDLIGRYDLQGGILTDGAATALNSSGTAAVAASQLVFQDVNAPSIVAEQELVEFFARFGDVSIDAAGISGLNEGLIDGISLSITDTSTAKDTFKVDILTGDDAAQTAIDALSNLEAGDILDTLSAIGQVLVVAGETLAENLPFLSADIPLLNFSLLDAVSFSADFIDALRELRDHPQEVLSEIEKMLESVFGADTINLNWDGLNQTIMFEMSFGFLQDYQEVLPFNIDLASLLGDALSGLAGTDQIAEFIRGIADVSGDGAFVFDPDLSMDFVFGLDLSPTLAPLTSDDFAELTSDLDALSSVFSVTTNGSGQNDLQITRQVGDGDEETVSISLHGITTLGDAITQINDALSDPTTGFGSTVGFEFDATTGQITLSDSLASMTDDTGVTALFGAATAEATQASTDAPFMLDIASGFSDWASKPDFVLNIGDPAVAVTVSLAADAEPSNAEEYVAALNAALAALSIPRSVLGDTVGPVLGIDLDQLIRAEVISGTVRLVTTNFASASGYDIPSFSVSGVDTSVDVQFTIEELGTSNAAGLLGFDADEASQGGVVISDALYESTNIGAPRVFLDTEKSGVKATFAAGVDSGLNVKIGVGPLEVAVVNGTAKLTDGTDTGGPAHLGFSFIDADGDEHADEYDLSDIFDIANDDTRSYLDILKVDAAIGVDINLPFSDNVGLFKPDDHMFEYKADLLKDKDKPLSDLSSTDLTDFFEGDLIELAKGNGISADKVVLKLPDIENLLSNFNYLEFLNNPKAVLDGLDIILNQMQVLFDDYLSDIELPVVGDAIGAGVTFFDDFRYNVLEEIRALAETPKADGTLPTTVDLLTDQVNNLLNDLFGTTDKVYMVAALVTEGLTAEESYFAGALSFTGEIFNEDLAIDFDFGVPGLDLEVEEGSKINFALDYTVNIGFGIDQRGFYLLNDTDKDEVSITIKADAGSFAGSASVLGVLGLTAEAITLDADTNGNIKTNADGSYADGTAYVSATVGADLYGDDAGTAIGDGGDAERDLSELGADFEFDGAKAFETLIYFNEVDFGNLIEFTFGASFDIQIALSGSVLNPVTDAPLLIGGFQIIPTIATEFVLKGEYTYGEDLNITALSFENVRLDMQQLYDALLKPILDPIMDVVNPVAEYFEWTQETPFKEALSVVGSIFPVIGIANQVTTIALQVRAIVNTLSATGGQLVFGDFDFSGNAAKYAAGEGSLGGDAGSVQGGGTKSAISGSGGQPFGFFGNISQGIAIEIPLLSQPTNILNLILGNFDQVDLAVAHLNLFNIDTGRINIAGEILGAAGLPGWVSGIVSSAFHAEVSLRFQAGFSAGYDLGGIVNFVNTLDPERLLDGVFVDSAPGSLISAAVTGSIGLNAGLAGATAAIGAAVNLAFNDPNGDGKLRIPEMIALVDAAFDALENGNIEEALGIIFVGDAYYGAKLSIWAGINLPWPLPDLKWSTTVFDIGGSIDFGGNAIPAQIFEGSSTGTNTLNIGARAGASMTKIVDDGDDEVTVKSETGGYNVTYDQAGLSTSGTVSGAAGAIVIPAGEGDNTINLSGVSSTIPTVVYTGAGTDTVTLPASGIHVVFAGDGNDIIKTNGPSTGTYIVFGGGGSDTVNIQGGNVIYLAGDDFGARDLFLAEFSGKAVTKAEIEKFFSINASGVPIADATSKSFELNNVKMDLATLLENYTSGSQLSADKAAETVTVGTGNHVILTGSGADTITINGTAADSGTMTVLSGAGDDVVTIANGKTVLVEGGAGSDRIYVNAETSTLWGYGSAGGTEGLVGTATSQVTDALSIRDGMDILVGGAGDDTIHGQLGNDIIEGGLGDDVITGGLGIDILIGGTSVIQTALGIKVAIKDILPNTTFSSGITVAVADAADGKDTISGGVGGDIIIGGGDDDILSGGAAGDVILGDFGIVELSANLVAQSVKTQFDSSENSGNDTASGNGGNDTVIVGGGRADSTTIETVVDLQGSNVILGDFGEVSGARISEAVTYLKAYASAKGSDDTITTGSGNDIIMGGEGNDTINAGKGADIVIGDLGILDIANSEFESIESVNAGNDTVTFGGSDDDRDLAMDIMVGGDGNDTATGQAGGMVFLGDDGQLTLDPVALKLLLSYTGPAKGLVGDELEAAMELDQKMRDEIAKVAKQLIGDTGNGNDSVTVNSGTLIAVLGYGNDSASNSGADDVVYVLGDNGTISISDDDVTLTSLIAEIDADDTDGNDTVTSGAGADWVILGQGDDVADLGAGDNRALGDSGTLTADVLASSSHADGGADQITTLGGADAVIGGAGADVLDLGDGDNIALGDAGRIDGPNTTIQSDRTAGDGADTISTGTGADQIIGGGAGDMITAGDGDNVIIGDSGSYAVAGLVHTVSSTRTDGDGNDTISAGDGADWVIGGGESDAITAGDGANVILGDSGSFVTDGTTLTLTSVRTEGDGTDTISTGSDRDLIIGGGAGDTVTAGDGDNVILGDSGAFDGTTLTSALTARDGNDTVTSGAGADWVILGQGDDVADLGAGDNRALGDSGTLTADVLASSSHADGGADQITTLGGADAVIGGAGADVLDLGDGDNIALGDAGRIDGPNTTIQSDRTAGDGADTISTGTGADQIIGGGAGDTITAGDGDNVIIGDSGSYAVAGAVHTVSSTRTDGDGADTISAGDGADWVIGGGDADAITAGEGANVILGDSGSFVTDGATLTLTSVRTEGDGIDTISTGSDRDLIIGGGAGDTVTAGDGDNVILGDSGTYEVTADRATLISDLTDGDAQDDISAGVGNDWIIAGGAADTVDASDGDNVILGDSGHYEVTATRIELVTEQTQGDASDDITAGSGKDLILAGGAADTVHAGDGDNVILGDSGSYVEDGTDRTLISALGARDENDTITAGAGDDWAILGQGNDTAVISDGDNRILGDSGTIVQDDSLTLTTTSNSFGGVDQITTGAGNDIVLAGSAGDTVHGGAGDNAVLGDNGQIIYDPSRTSGLTEVRTVVEVNGGADRITTEGGRDILVGGEAGDTIKSGAGADIILGDQGFVTGSSATVNGQISSLLDEVPGNDIIDAGAGDDMVVAGLGDDFVQTGSGHDLVLGDSGDVTFTQDAELVTVVMTDQDRGGDDEITGAGFAGDKVIIGQFGEDRINGGTDDDVIFGDLAVVTFRPYEEHFEGQSSADRVNYIEAIRPDMTFDDVLFGDGGADFMMGGMGDDALSGDGAQDILIGDTAILVRTWDDTSGELIETTTIDTNFAFTTGGYDTIRGGTGNDIMIGGLGADLFFGNTQQDLIYSDGYAGIFTATWTDGYLGETPKRYLLTSNFAGSGAIDVVSEAQQDSSIGGPLDYLASDNVFEDTEAGDRKDYLEVLAAFGGNTALINDILAILGRNSTTESIVLLLMGGADVELIKQALLEEINGQLMGGAHQDVIQMELLIRAVIAEHLSNAGLVNERLDNQSAAEGDRVDAYHIAAE